MAFTAFSSAFSKGPDDFFVVSLVSVPPKPAPGPLLLKVGTVILRSSNSICSIGNCSNQSSL